MIQELRHVEAAASEVAKIAGVIALIAGALVVVATVLRRVS
jgi:hypothetical protein